MPLSPSLPPSDERPRRILVVDEDLARAGALVTHLLRDGYDVESIARRGTLLAHTLRRSPDLLLLHVSEPVDAAIQACADLRMHEHLRVTPIILLTAADVDEQTVVSALLGGADDVFSKPTRYRELSARIRVQLRNRRDRELLQWARARRDNYRDAALRDSLTDLPNRRAADLSLAAAVDACEPITLLVIDIDHFKELNDKFGHLRGDDVLKSLGALLRRVARASDTVARFGGEEFIVIARGVESPLVAKIAERYREAVCAMPPIPAIAPTSVTVSVGAAHWDGSIPRPTVAALFEAADAALYDAKRAGRNRISVADHIGVVGGL